MGVYSLVFEIRAYIFMIMISRSLLKLIQLKLIMSLAKLEHYCTVILLEISFYSIEVFR